MELLKHDHFIVLHPSNSETEATLPMKDVYKIVTSEKLSCKLFTFKIIQISIKEKDL